MMIRLSVPDIGDEECQAVERVLRSGQLVHGEECELFEKELAQYLDCKDVIVVSSGTAALHLALVASGIGPGDAVIVPDFTFPATANSVELVGARPILIDVDLGTYNITPDNIRRVINEWQGKEKIRAIMPVHEFGCPADMTAIMEIAKEYDLKVIEDAACGLGATHNEQKVGTFGIAGCFSFHPRKAITTGEGGAIATNDTELAAKLRYYRNHGIIRHETGMDFVTAGFNYRLTNFQAALGRVQLKKFDSWLKKRNELQGVYRNGLQHISVLLPKEVQGHAWQTFMVVLPEQIDRMRVIASLKERNIEANLGAQSIHCLEYYKKKYSNMCMQLEKNNAQRLYTHGLAMPFYQGMTEDQLAFVIEEFGDVLNLQG
jgi:perosamine synthetase